VADATPADFQRLSGSLSLYKDYRNRKKQQTGKSFSIFMYLRYIISPNGLFRGGNVEYREKPCVSGKRPHRWLQEGVEKRLQVLSHHLVAISYKEIDGVNSMTHSVFIQ
jgi:hypothetical protein